MNDVNKIYLLDNLRGYLLSIIQEGQPFGGEYLRDSNIFTYKGKILGTDWETYNFTSKCPLLDEEKSEAFKDYGVPLPTSFNYPLICRWSGNRRALMLSTGKRVIEHFLNEETIFPEIFRPSLKRIYLKIDKFVQKLIDYPEDSPYSLANLHARIPGFSDDLRTISFYGNNITESKVFRNNKRFFVGYSCGVRLLDTGSDLLRIGSDGSVSLPFSFSIEKNYNKEHADQVEKFLAFLRDNEFFSEKF